MHVGGRVETGEAMGRAVRPARAVLVVLLLLLGVFSDAARAQPGADPTMVVAEVEAAYEALDYPRAEALARRALDRAASERPGPFTPSQLVRLHTTLGLLLYAQNDALAAAEQFRSALFLDPTLELDPVLVSPVTVAFFDDTKAAFLRERAGDTRPEGTTAAPYIIVHDERAGSALRSLAMPGWGQRARGARTLGWTLTGVWAATLSGAAVAHVQRGQAREAYLGATTPEETERLYAPYNRWHKLRGALLVGTGAVYAAALFDALLSGAPEAPGPPARLRVEPGGAGLRLRVGL